MFCQQVDPNWVEATLESRSAEVIWAHASTEPITLRGLTSLRGNGAVSNWVTYRIRSQTHRLTMTGDKEIHIQSIVDRILDLHLRSGQRNVNEESPKSVCANDTVEADVNVGVKTHNIYTHPPRPLYT